MSFNPPSSDDTGVWLLPGDGSPSQKFLTIAAALAASVAGRRDVVRVGTGVYAETLDVDTATTTLQAVTEGGSTVIEGNVVLSGDLTELQGLEARVSSGIGIDLVGQGALARNSQVAGTDPSVIGWRLAENTFVRGATSFSGTLGIPAVVAPGALPARCAIESLSPAPGTVVAGPVVDLQSGELDLDNVLGVVAGFTSENLVRVAGGTVLRAQNLLALGSTFAGANAGALRITGDDANVSITNARLQDLAPGTLALLVDPGVTTGDFALSGGTLDRDAISADPAYLLQSSTTAFFFDPRTGDEALVALSELVVGRAGLPREAVFGEGDSFPVTRAFREDAGGTFTDVTAALQSVNGSTVPLFDTGAIGDTLWIGSPLPFPGITIDTTVASVPGANTEIEFAVSDSGGGLTDVRYMVTTGPRTRAARQFCETVTNDQIYMQIDGVTPGQITVNGVNLFWLRIQVTDDPLVAVPEAEQVKIGTNRVEIDNQSVRLFGTDQTPLELEVRRFGLQGVNPNSAEFDVGAFILRAPASRFRSGDVDAFGGTTVLPPNLDTSRDLEYTFQYKANNGATGNAVFTFFFGLFSAGDDFGPVGVIPLQVRPAVIAFPGNAQRLENFTFRFNLNSIQNRQPLPGDNLFFALQRDGTSGGDTLGSAVDIAPDDEMLATRWFL